MARSLCDEKSSNATRSVVQSSDTRNRSRRGVPSCGMLVRVARNISRGVGEGMNYGMVNFDELLNIAATF